VTTCHLAQAVLLEAVLLRPRRPGPSYLQFLHAHFALSHQNLDFSQKYHGHGQQIDSPVEGLYHCERFHDWIGTLTLGRLDRWPGQEDGYSHHRKWWDWYIRSAFHSRFSSHEASLTVCARLERLDHEFQPHRRLGLL
jgi:hypothetical protein